MFVALDTTFAALADVARPFIQETISETPPTLDAATDDAAAIRPVPRQQRDAVHRPAARASQALADDGADDRRRRSRPGPRRCATRRRSTAQLRADRRGAARASTTTPASATGLDRLTQTVDILGPTLRFIAPAQTVCNYGDAAVPQRSPALLSQGDGGRHLAAVHRLRAARRAQQRGQPVAAAPANGGGDDRATSSTQPVPEHRRAGPDRASARPATSPTPVGQQVIGNVPGNQGTVTDDQPGARPRRAADEAPCEAQRRAARPRAAAPRRPRSGAAATAARAVDLRRCWSWSCSRSLSYLAFTKELPVHRARATSSRRPSRTPRPCARPRRCGSPASTSAR